MALYIILHRASNYIRQTTAKQARYSDTAEADKTDVKEEIQTISNKEIIAFSEENRHM